MRTIFQKNTCTFPGILLISVLFVFFLSCKKDMNSAGTETVPEIPGVLPDLQTKVSSSVSGFVTDQQDAPVVGAAVNAGSSTTVTDRYGYFEIKNVRVVKEAATVTVSYMGYFKAIKTYMATEGKAAFFRIKLLQKTIIGTVDATAGGNVSLSNGMNISFPANAIKDANGNIYNGTINVAAHYLDPTSPELSYIMPGDLRGINTDGYMKGLTSFGMMGVELTGSAGEILQIADGKKSTITMPMPSSILSEATATIPLWHFDESNGLWKEEGTATKTGNTYVGEVGHFSWWNCDLPNATVHVQFKVIDSIGHPINNAHVEILPLTPNSWSHVGGYTDASGMVSVFVTADTRYKLEVFTSCINNTPNYLHEFNVSTNSVDLGNISIGNGQLVTVSGTLTSCANAPVTNGYIICKMGANYVHYPLSGPGSFNFQVWNCAGTGGNSIQLIGIDADAARESSLLNYTINSTNNAVGNLQACGVSTGEYLSYTINGGAPHIFDNTNSITDYWQGHTSYYYTHLLFQRGSLELFQMVIAGSTPLGLGYFDVSGLAGWQNGPIPAGYPQNPANNGVTITEFGSIGQFVSGYFDFNFIDSNTLQVLHFVGNFRIRRLS